MKKKLVVLTGAGISAESGIATFRDSNGLWENHKIEDVATPEGFIKNPGLVLEFYNQRRKNCLFAKPNKGHEILVDLENYYDVTIITQNVDNLHEKAGSSHILHLHGELFKVRSIKNENLISEIKGWELNLDDFAIDGAQLRPHIVWFGEAVPMIEKAIELVSEADILVIVGTSMQVYPAAGLIHNAGHNVPIYVIDPKKPDIKINDRLVFIEEIGSVGLDKLKKMLV
jgi:NAD-dependent deacetylase